MQMMLVVATLEVTASGMHSRCTIMLIKMHTALCISGMHRSAVLKSRLGYEYGLTWSSASIPLCYTPPSAHNLCGTLLHAIKAFAATHPAYPRPRESAGHTSTWKFPLPALRERRYASRRHRVGASRESKSSSISSVCPSSPSGVTARMMSSAPYIPGVKHGICAT